MSTPLQKNLAQEIIKDSKTNKPRTKKDLLVSAGYDVITAAASPGRTIEQKGVKEALNDFGFNVDNAKKVVAEILLDSDADPNPRLKASDQIFKVHGAYAPEKTVSLNLNGEVTDEIQAMAAKISEELKQKKLNDSSTN